MGGIVRDVGVLREEVDSQRKSGSRNRGRYAARATRAELALGLVLVGVKGGKTEV